MDHRVSIVLKNGQHHQFVISVEELAEFEPAGAREWIMDKFFKAELETPNPTGKLLIVDAILLLAENYKPSDYDPLSPEVRRFLVAALAAMRRPTLNIDLGAHTL